ncbi:MAG: hypothetical protein AMS18_12860 [Gemmatimonas sp. SG8_17]|nr:MAG: hypothetical protein AMS18_12860 [Gemmatimonas sp. SG8_17]
MMISRLPTTLRVGLTAAATTAVLGVPILAVLSSCGADRAPPVAPDSLTAPTLSQPIVRSPEPACSRSSTIICEDFESDDRGDWSDYHDDGFAVISGAALSGQHSMQQEYALGQESAGWLAWFFGDHPLGGVRSSESFADVYFRLVLRLDGALLGAERRSCPLGPGKQHRTRRNPVRRHRAVARVGGGCGVL